MSDKQQASISIASIKINGASDITIERDLEEIVIDTTYNLPSMATIRLHDPQMKWVDGTKFKLGAVLSISLGPPLSMKKVEAAEVFLGEIVAIEPTFSALGTHTLTIRAYDKSHRLHIGTKSRTFIEMKDSDIVRKIVSDAGLQAGTISSTKSTHKYVVQANLSDFEFLSMRAQRAGFQLSVNKGKVDFQNPKSMTTGPVLEMGETLRELSVRMSAARQATKTIVRGWDVLTKKAITAQGQPTLLWRENGVGKTGGAAAQSAFGSAKTSEYITLVPQTNTEAEELVAAVNNDHDSYFTEADGVSYGHPGLVAGVKVELKFVSTQFSGKYYVTSATHIWNAAGYETHFTVAGRYPQTFNQLLNGNHAGAVEPGSIHGVVVGVVTNVGDPDNLGRVKVKFPWMYGESSEIESNWARVAAPMAGAQRGYYFLPEVDDEVLVTFEHGNPNYPYIVGYLWNGKDKPPEANNVAHANGKTVHRMLVTRSGHKVVFDDSDDKKSVTIIDATGEQLVFMDSVKKNVEIKSGGNMLIDAKGNLNIKVGGNMTTEVTGNIKTTGTNIETKANSNMKLESHAMLSMKSGTSANLEGVGSVGIKGTIMKIEASGPMTVKGMPIALN